MSLSRRSFMSYLSGGLLSLPLLRRASAQGELQAEASQATNSIEPLPFIEGSWTVAVLPDTQVYAMGKYAHHFVNQTRWIAENKARHNIAYVLHLGDIVNNNNVPQWEVAQKAMRQLDGVVPYAMAPGNHDYGTNGTANTRETLFNEYFPHERYKAWPTLGGVMENGRMDNSYHVFSAGGRDWIVLALEWGPRDATVAWANKILAQHPHRLGILITHAYTYYDDSRYDHKARPDQKWNPHSYGTGKDAQGTNDGEELWQKLVSKHPNMVLAINGHVLEDGLGRLSSAGAGNNLVHQMLVNYQMKREGGEGFLRLLEFLPDGKTLQVKAYSPSLNQYKTDPQNQFTLDLTATAARPQRV